MWEALYFRFVTFRSLECTSHKCQSKCHPDVCEPCKLLPSAVNHCPCGRSLLTELTNEKRKSCLDAIPTCDNVCEKDLPCGPAGMYASEMALVCFTHKMDAIYMSMNSGSLGATNYFNVLDKLFVPNTRQTCKNVA